MGQSTDLTGKKDRRETPQRGRSPGDSPGSPSSLQSSSAFLHGGRASVSASSVSARFRQSSPCGRVWKVASAL
ncbi:hypothetical protein RRG08_037437 [Elysia crispata]|uniref:Uncharacterized protein n=1 Tax=Elysia crispata TaxID=231223 RepID=A0AAE0Y4A2_9GAST|nr:hypothetical protein RRG08_037437 [Elysia crispata]